MEEHLSPELVDAYRQQRLRPAELIRADDHLTACAGCRRRLEAALSGSAVALQAELRATAEALPDELRAPHLTFEQMAQHIDGTLDHAKSLIISDHLASCLPCKLASDELRAFKGEDVAPNPVLAPSLVPTSFWQSIWERAQGLFWPSSPVPALGWALAVVLILGLAGWMIRSAWRPKSPAPELAKRDEQPTQMPSTMPLLTPPAVAHMPETAPLLAQLADGPGQVTLDRDGKLSGLEGLPPASQRLVKDALTMQRIPASRALEGLNRRGSSLMGADDEGNQFVLLAPTGKVVQSERPTFRWTALGGAAGYVVEIYDEQFNLAATSDSLQRTEWTPPQPLARGRVYAWQVKATKDGQEVQAPKPPAAQARFRVLAQPAAEEIAAARRTASSSHLMLGLLYAQAGLLDEAEQEFRTLLKANPDSAVVRRWLAQVQALRR